MIPVALNADRFPDDDAGKFFRTVMKTNNWPQGIWIVAPDGKVLAFHYFRAMNGESPSKGKARWAQETLDAIEKGLTAFGPLQPRELKPHNPIPERGIGLLSNDGVRLAAFGTYLRNGKRDGDPVVDSIILTAEEWKTFQPRKLEVGAEWSVSEKAARRFAPVLSPLTDSIYAPLPKDAKIAKIDCRVEKADAKRVLIRLTGTWETEHFREDNPKLPIRADAKADGYAEYDPAKKQVTSLLLVLKGNYRNVPPWDTVKSTAGVVEWQLDSEK
jgi:hypothetical protein